MRFREGEAIHARSARPVAHFVSRLCFDAEFVQRAWGAGAEIREEESVRDVAPEADAVTVVTNRRRCRDPRVRFVRGDMTRLPYPDRSFDVVVSTWAIETLQEPKAAAREFLRVIKDDGVVIYTFCSLPEGGMARLGAQVTEALLARWFAFRFLPRRKRPYHSCARSRLVTFFGGLLTLVVLRKCCAVEDETAPCVLPTSWEEALLEAPAPDTTSMTP